MEKRKGPGTEYYPTMFRGRRHEEKSTRMPGKGQPLRWKESREVEAWKLSRGRAQKVVSGGVMVHNTLLGDEQFLWWGHESLVRLSSRENKGGRLGIESTCSTFKEYPVHLH